MSPPPSVSPSAAASQEEVTNQTLMSVIMDLRAQLTSISRRQDEMMQLILNVRCEVETRTEPTVRVPPAITNPAPEPEPAPSVVPKEADSVATASVPSSSQQGAKPAVVPPTKKRTRPIPAPERRIKRQNAFYHISNAEEGPWKAPGGYHPNRDGTHPTRERPTPERPTPPASSSLHQPVSRPRASGSRVEGNRLPPPYSLFPPRPPAPQQSQASPSLPAPPLPQAMSTRTLALLKAATTLPTQPAPTPRREGPSLYTQWWFARTQPVAPGPGTPQSRPYPPTTAHITPADPPPSPKRKREDAEDATDDEKALVKKRSRRPSDDID